MWKYIAKLKLSVSYLWTKDVNLWAKNSSASHHQLLTFVPSSICFIRVLPGLWELCWRLCSGWECSNFSSFFYQVLPSNSNFFRHGKGVAASQMSHRRYIQLAKLQSQSTSDIQKINNFSKKKRSHSISLYKRCVVLKTAIKFKERFHALIELTIISIYCDTNVFFLRACILVWIFTLKPCRYVALKPTVTIDLCTNLVTIQLTGREGPPSKVELTKKKGAPPKTLLNAAPVYLESGEQLLCT